MTWDHIDEEPYQWASDEINKASARILRDAGIEPAARTKGRLGLKDRMLTATDLDTLPEPEWLIDEYIPAAGFVVLYGKPNGYKSFTAVDWALSVATGEPWAGMATKAGRTLYVAAEGIAGMQKRKRAWQENRGVAVNDTALFLPVAVNLLDTLQVAELLELVGEIKPALIVIDTMARCLVGGDENSARDVGRAVDVATLIIQTTGATVVIVHHTSKSGESYRGSSALEGAADTMIEVESEGTGLVTYKMVKQKDASKADPLTLQAVEMSDSVCLKRVASGVALRDAELKLLATLSECFGELEVTPNQWEKVAGITGNTFYRARKALVGKGFVLELGTKQRPRYTMTTNGTRQLAIHSPTGFGEFPQHATTATPLGVASGEWAGDMSGVKTVQITMNSTTILLSTGAST